MLKICKICVVGLNRKVGDVARRAGHRTKWGGLGKALTMQDGLENLNSFLPLVMDHLPAMVFVKDANTLTYTLVNREVERVFGRPREAWIGKTVYEMFPLDEATLHDENDRKTLSSGTRQDFPEIQVQTPSGQQRWFHTQVLPVAVRDGQVSHLVGIAQDVTTQHATQMALTESEEKYRCLVELSPDAVLVHSDEVYVYANPAAVKLFRARHTQELVGLSIWDTVPEKLKKARRPLIREVYAQKRTLHRFESEVVYLDGTVLPVEVSATGIAFQGKPSVLVILHDISERLAAQRQVIETETRNQAQLRALSNRLVTAQENERRRIAHDLHDEFGQTLMAIGLQLATIEHTLGKRTPGKLREQIRSAQALADQMLDQVRALTLELRPPRLKGLGLVAAMRWLVDQTRNSTDLDVEFTVDPKEIECPHEVSLTLYRALQEAFNNVIRHAQAKRVKVGLQRDEKSIVMTVEDDGVGFDPTPPPEKIAGLGLVGMRERIATLNGQIEIRSTTGRGTHIRIRLPA